MLELVNNLHQLFHFCDDAFLFGEESGLHESASAEESGSGLVRQDRIGGIIFFGLNLSIQCR